MNAPNAKTQRIGYGLLILAAVVVAYWPALHGGMIIDDPEHITKPELRPLSGLWRIWFEIGATAHYYPLLNTVFWIEYHLWGDAVLGYHLVNVLQHAASAWFVMAIMRRLALPGAWLGGLLFALHPVAVESVAWMTEQKNTLSGLFCLAACYVYLGFDRDRRPARYALATCLFVLALLTKSVTATLAPTLLVIFWWQRGKLAWRRDVLPLVPWFVVGAAAGLFSAWFERTHSNAEGTLFDLSFVERCLVAGRAIVFYARTLLWPSNLMFVNPRWTIDASAAWQYIFPLAVLLVAGALLWRARHQRGPLAAFLIFTGTLFPTLGFLNINWFGFSYVADHFQYLAMIGVLVPSAVGMATLAQRIPASRTWFPFVVGGGLAIVLGVLTWRQSRLYRDGETLYRDNLARNPACWLAHNNLGAILATQPDRLDEAISHFEATLRLKPDHIRAHNNLGFAFMQKPGRLADAVAAFRGSLRLQPGVTKIHTHLAHALAQMPGRENEAIAEYRNAVRLDATNWEALVGLGNLLARLPGQEREAIAAYASALQLKTDAPDLYNNYGGLLGGMPGRTQDAIAAFENALRLKPDYAEAHFNLASLLADIPGRLTEAIRHYETALRLAPGDPAIHNNLGLALMQLPERRADAIRHFHATLQAAPDSAEAHFNLGRLYLTAPVDEATALRHLDTAAQMRPDWEAPRRLAAQVRGN